MKGTKRFCPSDSNADLKDSTLRSKRIMEPSPFNFHMAEPSRMAEQPPLDTQRAESSRQHVRALNTQFASWVQSQLQNHPDELWEDGVQDYLTHASQIMDNFSDVVAWLKAKVTKAENVSIFGFHGAENKMAPENKNNETKFQLLNHSKVNVTKRENVSVFGLSGIENKVTPEKKMVLENKNTETKFQLSNNSKANAEKPEKVSTFGFFGSENKAAPANKNSEVKFQLPVNSVFTSTSTTPSFSSSWGTGTPSKAPTSFLFGNQSSAPVNSEASNDPEEDDVERPSSPSVKKTEEEGVVVVHEVKCKLYIKSTDPADKDPWKDRGLGQLSIKCKDGVAKASKDSKPTIIVRNDVGKVLLNALIYPGIKTNLIRNNGIAAIFHTSEEASGNDTVMARTYLIKTKAEEINKLASAIQKYAPTA